MNGPAVSVRRRTKTIMAWARAAAWAALAATAVLLFTHPPIRTPGVIVAGITLTIAVIIAHRHIEEMMLGQEEPEREKVPPGPARTNRPASRRRSGLTEIPLDQRQGGMTNRVNSGQTEGARMAGITGFGKHGASRADGSGRGEK